MGIEKEVQKASAKAKASLERLDDLEKIVAALNENLNGQGTSIKQIVQAVNGAIGKLSRDFEESREMLNAVIGILGPAQVQTEVENSRKIALDRQVAETKASIASALETGDIVKAEKASDKSFVAGVETKADGTVIAPGWAFVPMSKIEEEFRTQLVGQGIGFKVVTKEGGAFELLEIYEAVEKPVEAPVPVASTDTAPTAVQG